MSAKDLALFFQDSPTLWRDPFSAMLPFATGSSHLQKGRHHRDMPIDVKEVCTELG
jgi:hypothetical protein